ncbi:hypothetical protein C3E97_018905 [Pseudomonas sp. MWU12-2115]|nr:hypothetical protein C3E97_018905 [Pseudomonas sp. MWU12-2115]
MGAGLLAKAISPSPSMLADPTPSRASPLPQGICDVSSIAPYASGAATPDPAKGRSPAWCTASATG